MLSIGMRPQYAQVILDGMVVHGDVVRIEEQREGHGGHYRTMNICIAVRDTVHQSEKETGEEEGMKTNVVAALLMEGVKTVGVKFNEHGIPSSKTYTYKTMDDLAIGDKVIVDSPKSGIAVVEIVRVDEICALDVDSAYGYKWIVQKVDTEQYDSLNAREETFQKELMKIQQDSVVKNAKQALIESMGIEYGSLDSAIEDLNKKGA